jgi:hypothetical protein
MPAIMMTAEATFMVKEKGSSSEIVGTGPSPGSTPITVPTKTPTKQ